MLRFLRHTQRSWDRFAQTDPMWAVLSDPAKYGGLWNRDEFFATGEREIADLWAVLLANKWIPNPLCRALDFGCGVGRLSQALALRVPEVIGVDLSPEMIAHAQRYCAEQPNIRWLANADLWLPFPDSYFSLVYSNLTLQHVAPALARGYIREFMRILMPGGIAVFQVPSRRLHSPIRSWRDLRHRIPVSWRLNLRRLWDPTTTTVKIASIITTPKVYSWIRKGKGVVLTIQSTPDPNAGFVSTFYYARADKRTLG